MGYMKFIHDFLLYETKYGFLPSPFDSILSKWCSYKYSITRHSSYISTQMSCLKLSPDTSRDLLFSNFILYQSLPLVLQDFFLGISSFASV